MRRPNVFLVLSTLAVLLAAPAQAQPASTLEKAKASGSLTVAYRESSIPFSYLGGRPASAGRSAGASSSRSGRPPAAPT
jgi:ABC-type amino acid transport substrate-binding protein